jgi:hypothetical protein
MASRFRIETNRYSNYVYSYFYTENLKPKLNGLSELQNGKQSFYLLYPLNLRFDEPEYKDLFRYLQKLKLPIKNEEFISLPAGKRTNIKSEIDWTSSGNLYFRKNEVKLLNLESITPQTLEELQQILKENLDD